MTKALIGFFAVIGIVHLFLIVIPLKDSLQASIPIKSKAFWCSFLMLLPIIGAFVFHCLFKSGAYQGKNDEISAAEERARSGTLSPDDNE
jgi:uncharacterized membrane protein YjfL (UPF0719 family)